jgi:hypothetical protein
MYLLILNIHSCKTMTATIAFPMIIVAGIRNIRATAFRTLSTIWCRVCKVSQYPAYKLTHSIRLLLIVFLFIPYQQTYLGYKQTELPSVTRCSRRIVVFF